MPTLDPSRYGGPVRAPRDCGCPDPATPSTSPNMLPTSDPCAEGEGNVPVTDSTYQCSPMVGIQSALDRARRVVHEIGVRPYRVFIVWQERNRDRDLVEVARKELMPVRVDGLDGVDLSLGQAGLQAEGAITLREVSPAQTNEDELRGYLNGVEWVAATSDREYFYEVQASQRCAGETEPRRRRFILASEPFLQAGSGEFRVRLVDQEIARRDGQDRTVVAETNGPRLVT